jgi:hypothetical protein
MNFMNTPAFEFPGQNKVINVELTNLAQNSSNAFPDDNDLKAAYILGISFPSYVYGTDVGPTGDPTPPIAELRRLILNLQTREKEVAVDGIPIAQLLANPGTGGFAIPIMTRFRDGLPVSLNRCNLFNPGAALTAGSVVPVSFWYCDEEEAMWLRKHRAAQMALQIAMAQKQAAEIYDAILQSSSAW